MNDVLELFHPAVAAWFRSAFAAPTAPQIEAWPAIRSGRHVLVAAPTGSGKTLAAFLAAIDALVRQGVAGTLPDAPQVVYVSPLKALSNDVQRNLEAPLGGIRAELAALGLPDVEIRTLVRTGDTPQAERASMRKRPPHVVVTTPESLHILLTSASGRKMLATTRTVIVDEIHALAPNKRGAHLALSLERLEALAGAGLVRVGLSATQKPIEEIGRFLVGANEPCAIVDTGHVRRRDLALELPDSLLEAVTSGDVWQQIYDRIAALAGEHRTTLAFVNTRRLAERAARELSERLGEANVAAHHGSLSREIRLDAEQRLKRGELKLLVATASLELGIDIGDVDLVCQVGSTRTIAAFLQRVGRSGHAVGGLPKGRLFPLTRDDLCDAAALLDTVRRGELDRVTIPAQPLDVLAQQIVSEVAQHEWREADLFERFRRAHPFRALRRDEFDEVVRMLAEGFDTSRGRRSAHVHRDAVNGVLRGRRGSALTAVTSAGTIPDTADYAVVLEPQATVVGSVNEDFAVESLAGDVFQLGNTSYRILRVERGTVRVEDAKGAPPGIPFWFGEAPARSEELSLSVSRLRGTIAGFLRSQPPSQGEGGGGREDVVPSQRGESREARTPIPAFPLEGGRGESPCGSPSPSPREGRGGGPALNVESALAWLTTDLGLAPAAAGQIVDYYASALAALGALPTRDTVVFERFFDESGGMQLVIHAPFGSRVNRAWGLALRKRFCRKFNFELQAAATEDAMVLSLSTSHSFPLEDVARYLSSQTVRPLLVQALLDAPMFASRWRWNATVALALPRFRGGKKVAPQLQRMTAEDLLAHVFPDQVACGENIVGDREIPDHPLVRQTIDDCLHEAMDIDGVERLLAGIERGEIDVLARDLVEPSPLALEVLSARPYAFLDDAPLEERRTQAVLARRWLDAETASDIGRLDPEAIARVRAEAWPDARDADELGDAMATLGFIAESEMDVEWRRLAAALAQSSRATRVDLGGRALWVAAERLPELDALLPGAPRLPQIVVPSEYRKAWTRDEALVELVRDRLQALGPVTAAALAEPLALPPPSLEAPLVALEAEGTVMRGRFTSDARDLEWCERRLLARIHRYTVSRLRAEIEPVEPRDLMRFLFRWQRVAPDARVEGVDALAAVCSQLEGFEAPAAAWETEILPARVNEYDPAWLDELSLAGRVAWARLASPRPGAERHRAPVRTTPIALLARRHLPLWSSLAATPEEPDASSRAADVADFIRTHGASFFAEIVEGTGRLRTEVEEALAELTALGRVTCDSFGGLRALLLPSEKRRSPGAARRRRRNALFGIEDAGRWALARRKSGGGADGTAAIEQVARTLLKRYGVVFWRLMAREAPWLPPWRELLRVYRRLEARGEVRGGRFVGGVSGEQYALPEAVSGLRDVRRAERTGDLVSLSAADPLNLVGLVTPGARVASLTVNRLLYRDGVPVACLAAGEVRFLERLDGEAQWQARHALLRRHVPPSLLAMS